MRDGAFSSAFRVTTVGVFALGFLIAFEALAVTTAMPLAARDLGDPGLYALTFSAFSATSVVGTVVGGAWSDRSGPTRPLLVGAAVFAAGLASAGAAGSMPALVVARAMQGLGSGAIGVTLYVLVSRAYPERLHPRVFALLAAAWVLPSLIGPFAAGIIATAVSWHWVFLGILPLVAGATALLVPTLRRTPRGGTGGRLDGFRILWAVAAAAALLALRPVLDVPTIGPVLAVVTAVVAVAALRPLLPPGALHAARGLPAVMAARGLFSAGFAAAETYLPYSLITLRDVPPALAGGIVTIGAVSWAVGSEAQSRLSRRLSDRGCVRVGAAAFLVGIAGVAAVTAAGAPIPVLGVTWLIAGLGIGVAYPRLSIATLALSARGEKGRSSASLQIADGAGNGLALTVVGVAAAFGASSDFVAAFGLAVVLALVVNLVAPRLSRPPG